MPTEDGDRDGGDVLVDGHGREVYAVAAEVVELHRRAVDAGWEHSYDHSPYENLRALLDTVDAKRSTIEAFAFRYIAGYGPGSTPQALDRLLNEEAGDA